MCPKARKSKVCYIKKYKNDFFSELLKKRIELWHRGKELDNWMSQAETRLNERLRQFPVNPDKMAKIISQYKGFTRELLARQSALESLSTDAGSLQVVFFNYD